MSRHYLWILALASTFLSFACSHGDGEVKEKEKDGLVAPKVNSLSTSEGTSGVSLKPTLQLKFTQSVLAASLTTNSAQGSCSGSLQVSADDFATCEALSLTTTEDQSSSYEAQPTSNLKSNQTYQIKVTTGVKSTDGLYLDQETSGSFTTRSTGVSLTSLSSQSATTALSSSISLTFDQAVQSSSLSTGQSSSCSGSLQLSYDSFSSCVALQSWVELSSDGTQATFKPLLPLGELLTYQVRVTSQVLASDGGSLSQQDLSFTTGQVWQGVKQWGGSGRDFTYLAQFDDYGRLTIGGYTTSSSFDGNSTPGGYDLVLMQFSEDGTKNYSKVHGSGSNENIQGMAVDQEGNLYLSAFANGTVDTYSTAGGNDAVLFKFNSSGDRNWTYGYGSTNGDYGRDVALTSSQAPVLVLDYMPSVVSVLRINKMTSSGGVDWTAEFSPSASINLVPYEVEVGSDDAIYVTGYVDGTYYSTHAGGKDMFLLKLNSSGGVSWGYQMGGSGDDEGRGLLVDSSGNVYVLGQTASSSFAGNTPQGTDMFVSKFDSSGAQLWTRLFGTSGTEVVTYNHPGILAKSGHLYLAMGVPASLNGQGFHGGASDCAVLKLNPSDGSTVWTRLWGTDQADYCYSIAEDRFGRFYATGETAGTWGATQAGSNDAILIKFSADGDLY